MPPKPRSQRSNFTFDVQSLGIDAKEAFDQSPQAPPPLYPPLRNNPLEQSEDQLYTELAEIRRKINEKNRSSSYYLPGKDGGVFIVPKRQALDVSKRVYDKRLVPTELADTEERRLRRRRTAKGPTSKRTKIDASFDVSFDFEALEQREDEKKELEVEEEDDDDAGSKRQLRLPVSEEPKDKEKAEEGKGNDSDNELENEDLEEEQGEEDLDEEELIESTDYINSYFDNGEDVDSDERAADGDVY